MVGTYATINEEDKAKHSVDTSIRNVKFKIVNSFKRSVQEIF